MREAALGAELREMEQRASPSHPLPPPCSPPHPCHAACEEAVPNGHAARRKREARVARACKRLRRLFARADTERLLRCFSIWTALPLTQRERTHSPSHASRLRCELIACEHALETQRRQHSSLHTECEQLRTLTAKLSHRLELELAHNQGLLQAGSNASKRASCATRELLASRRELVQLTARLAYGSPAHDCFSSS
ncbi:MAG: hypothetical protein SGPRY_001599 [Prymnesium sp.]